MATVLQLIKDSDVLHVTRDPSTLDALEAIVTREILADPKFKAKLTSRLQKAVTASKRARSSRK